MKRHLLPLAAACALLASPAFAGDNAGPDPRSTSADSALSVTSALDFQCLYVLCTVNVNGTPAMPLSFHWWSTGDGAIYPQYCRTSDNSCRYYCMYQGSATLGVTVYDAYGAVLGSASEMICADGAGVP